jgi:hypothetical protein
VNTNIDLATLGIWAIFVLLLVAAIADSVGLG